MNRKQRDANRRNAAALVARARAQVLARHTCENCGEKGGHWVSTRGVSLAALVAGQDDSEGFWTCPKLYGPDGRRLPEHIDKRWAMPADELALAALMVVEAERRSLK
jgi:hypothetical protein